MDIDLKYNFFRSEPNRVLQYFLFLNSTPKLSFSLDRFQHILQFFYGVIKITLSFTSVDIAVITIDLQKYPSYFKISCLYIIILYYVLGIRTNDTYSGNRLLQFQRYEGRTDGQTAQSAAEKLIAYSVQALLIGRDKRVPDNTVVIAMLSLIPVDIFLLAYHLIGPKVQLAMFYHQFYMPKLLILNRNDVLLCAISSNQLYLHIVIVCVENQTLATLVSLGPTRILIIAIY